MDILRFINSKDIRNHLEKIEYNFSSLEAAWLIFQCRTATIEEKHKAWTELINTMPDCEIKPRKWCNAANRRLHGFLKEYMETEDELVNRFYDECQDETLQPFVYSFEYQYKDGRPYVWNTVFSTMDALLESLFEPDKDVVRIKATKMQINNLSSWQIAYLNPRFEVLAVDPGLTCSGEEVEILSVFDDMWFDFATPFKKGDIVWDPEYGEGFCCTGPFALKGVCLEGIENEEVRKNIIEFGDTTDMCAGGYFVTEDGRLYQECMDNYMNLEYYDKALLTGPKRSLIAAGSFLKGELDPLLFAKAYSQIVNEVYAESSIPGDYLEEDLRRAGIMA